jgi:hypothetical protein
MNLTQYLRTTYGVHNSNVDFFRLVQPLYSKFQHQVKNEILIQGLIGMALGSYITYDMKLMELADETIKKFWPLL